MTDRLKEIEEWLKFIPTDEMEYKSVRYLLDTVKMLQQERNFLKKLEVVELKYGKLADENDRLREALEFYAERENHIVHDGEGPFTMIDNDDGRRARKALGRE